MADEASLSELDALFNDLKAKLRKKYNPAQFTIKMTPSVEEGMLKVTIKAESHVFGTEEVLSVGYSGNKNRMKAQKEAAITAMEFMDLESNEPDSPSGDEQQAEQSGQSDAPQSEPAQPYNLDDIPF